MLYAPQCTVVIIPSVIHILAQAYCKRFETEVCSCRGKGARFNSSLMQKINCKHFKKQMG